ncbi:MAG: hypothetical protein WC674_08555 [Candidatus Krumholzibacteriia bacterium]
MFAKTGPAVSINSVSAAGHNPNLAVGYSGGFAGISADFRMCLDAGYMVAVLSNFGAAPVSQKIQNLVGREKWNTIMPKTA